MEWGDAAAWAAAVVAIGAAGVAAFWSSRAVKASHRAATAAERTAAVEERTLHRQDQPVFTATIEDINNGGWHRLVLRFDGPLHDLDAIDVEWLDGGLAFSHSQDGVAPAAPPPTLTAWVTKPAASDQRLRERGGLEIGQAARWRVHRSGKEAESQATLRVVAAAGDREWRVLVKVDVPGTLQNHDFVHIV